MPISRVDQNKDGTRHGQVPPLFEVNRNFLQRFPQMAGTLTRIGITSYFPFPG